MLIFSPQRRKGAEVRKGKAGKTMCFAGKALVFSLRPLRLRAFAVKDFSFVSHQYRA